MDIADPSHLPEDVDGAASNVTELPIRPVREPRRDRERVRMSGQERREQLLDVGRRLFAEKGFEAVSVEEIASKAGVSKPVVYEHFGGKEGLYAVVVDREMTYLLMSISEALGDLDGPSANARVLLERAGFALFDYIEQYPDGFRILVRDSPSSGDAEVVGTLSSGRFASVIVDVAARVQDVLAGQFKAHGISPKLAPMYSQMLVGMVALTGQWWLDVRKPKKDEVVAHLVNLAWHGLEHMEPKPKLISKGKP
jgi:AcrR family transcriptional regulator